MSKFYEYTAISKLKGVEIFLLFLNLVAAPLLFYNLKAITILIMVNIFLFIKKIKESKRRYPKGYVSSLSLMTISYFLVFLMPFFGVNLFTSILFLIVLFSYSFVVVLLVFYVLNVVYFYFLKRIFPQEKEKEYIVSTSMRKLSKYIDLESQKLFFNITVINASVYIIFILYISMCLAKLISITMPGKNFVDDELLNWVINQEWISFSNFLAIVSFLIAFYSITMTTLNKIINKAKAIYRKELDAYKV